MTIIKNGDDYFNLDYFIHATVNGMGDIAIQFSNGQILIVSKTIWKRVLKQIDQSNLIDITEKED